MAKLLGHADRSDAEKGWSGGRTNGHYNGRRADQINGDYGMKEGEEARPYLTAQRGYEPG